MKLFTKLFIILSSILLYLGAVFVFNGVVVAEKNTENIDGKVLGVAEAANDNSLYQADVTGASVVYYGLPDSRNKRLIPEKKAQTVVPENLSNIALVMDERSDSVLFQQESEKIVPIASITKLATALVFLAEDISWDTIYEISDNDRVTGGRIYLYRGDKVQVRNLFFLSLVASANSATQAMVHATGLSNEDFVNKMNAKMRELGLVNTHFEDVVGLSANNKSNALEVAKLAKAALAHPEITEATMMKKYEFRTEQGKYKLALSTDALLDSLGGGDLRIRGGKTGYTDSAGYCFVGRYVNQDGNELLSVVLHENNINSRFESSQKLALWAFNNYLWN